MAKLKNIHAGEILLEEFLTPMDISQNALARGIAVTVVTGEAVTIVTR